MNNLLDVFKALQVSTKLSVDLCYKLQVFWKESHLLNHTEIRSIFHKKELLKKLTNFHQELQLS